MKEPKLYLVQIVQEDSEVWEIFASDAEVKEIATNEARAYFINAEMCGEEDFIELYLQEQVCGYKINLSK